MAIGPSDNRIHPRSAEEYADQMEMQIDAWLATQWRDPSMTCFQVPTYLQSQRWYDQMLEMVLNKYRPLWPNVHLMKRGEHYSCDFIVFVTYPCPQHPDA